jgi:anti-sigma B factor antagonist
VAAVNGDGPEPAPRAPFELAVLWGEDGSVRLMLDGELDIATAPRLHIGLEEVITRGRGDVHVNVTGLRFCGAAGINELLRARRSLEGLGRRLVLMAVPEQIARTIKLAEADALLDD